MSVVISRSLAEVFPFASVFIGVSAVKVTSVKFPAPSLTIGLFAPKLRGIISVVVSDPFESEITNLSAVKFATVKAPAPSVTTA